MFGVLWWCLIVAAVVLLMGALGGHMVIVPALALALALVVITTKAA